MSELNPSSSEANPTESPCTHDISDFCPSTAIAEEQVDPATCETRELPVTSGIR